MHKFIEEYNNSRDYYTEQANELNLRLIEYMQVRKDFVSIGPIAKRIDHCLQAFCVRSQSEVSNLILSTQSRIAMNRERLFKEFAKPTDKSLAAVPRAWDWVTQLSRHQLGIRRLEIEDKEAVISKLMTELQKSYTILPILFDFAFLIFIILLSVVAIFAPIFTSQWLEFSGIFWFISTAVLPFLFLGLAFVYVFTPCYEVFKKKRDAFAFKLYEKWWRESITRFHDATHLNYCELVTHLENVVPGTVSRKSVFDFFFEEYSLDLANAIYASAVPFKA